MSPDTIRRLSSYSAELTYFIYFINPWRISYIIHCTLIILPLPSPLRYILYSITTQLCVLIIFLIDSVQLVLAI